MNEYQKAYIALSRELLFSSNPLVITPKNPYKTTKSLHSSLECKIFFNKEKDVIYIFTYNGDVFDCKDLLQDINNLTNQNKQDLQNYNISIFLESTLLTGGDESKSLGYECFFGELESSNLDSHNAMGLDESKPIYHLINETDSNSIESTSNNIDSNNSLSTLQVFLGSNTLTLLNYSLLDSSLNIKLECTSKESKEILEREQAQRDCHDLLRKSRNDKINRNKDSSNDAIVSTAMLHPVLEDNELKCPHNGIVKLKSNKGKSFKSKGIPMILESDLLNSQIIGCTNNILGVPTPCTLVSVILPSARALKKHNDDYPIMQDLVSGNIFTDKGFPLIATPKPNTFKINSPSPSSAKEVNKESKEMQIDYHKPTFTICYKIDSLQKNSLNIYQCKINNKEIKNDKILQEYELNLKDCMESSNEYLPIDIQNDYKDKDFMYKTFRIVFDNHTREYILIIPKKIPKILNQVYKDNKEAMQNKDYGYGYFKLLDDTYREYRQDSIFSKQVWLIPYCCNKLAIKFGNENKDDTQSSFNGYNALSNIYVR